MYRIRDSSLQYQRFDVTLSDAHSSALQQKTLTLTLIRTLLKHESLYFPESNHAG